jgi:hypothetical protein
VSESGSNKLRDLAGLTSPDEVRRKIAEDEAAKERAIARISELEFKLAKSEKDARERSKDLVRLTELQKELNRQLELKELELQEERTSIHAAFAEREASLRKEIEIQQATLHERESLSRAQRAALEDRAKALEIEHAALRQQLVQGTIEQEKAKADLIRQKEQYEAEFQTRMEAKSAEFVDDALGSLRSNGRRFEIIGSAWAIAGLLAVIAGLVLAFILAQGGTASIVANKDISWALILFFAAKGAILLGLVVAVVRLCSKMARNYLHESIKNGERRHAINYGKFYLGTYGAGTDGEKLKDVFSQWNIEGKSAFSERDATVPVPPKLEVTDIAKTLNVTDITKTLIESLQKTLVSEKSEKK